MLFLICTILLRIDYTIFWSCFQMHTVISSFSTSNVMCGSYDYFAIVTACPQSSIKLLDLWALALYLCCIKIYGLYSYRINKTRKILPFSCILRFCLKCLFRLFHLTVLKRKFQLKYYGYSYVDGCVLIKMREGWIPLLFKRRRGKICIRLKM